MSVHDNFHTIKLVCILHLFIELKTMGNKNKTVLRGFMKHLFNHVE